MAGTVVFLAADEVSISLGGQYFFGDPGDEFRYYPASVYLKLDAFF